MTKKNEGLNPQPLPPGLVARTWALIRNWIVVGLRWLTNLVQGNNEDS